MFRREILCNLCIKIHGLLPPVPMEFEILIVTLFSVKQKKK